MLAPMSIKKAIEKSKCLIRIEERKLKQTLDKHKDIFDGVLEKIPKGEYHINIKDNTLRSLQKRCFPVPKYHKYKFKEELK